MKHDKKQVDRVEEDLKFTIRKLQRLLREYRREKARRKKA